MAKNGGDGGGRKGKSFRNNNDNSGKPSNKGRPSRNNRRTKPNDDIFSKTQRITESQKDQDEKTNLREEELLERITQLETLAASQTAEIRKLRAECNKLIEASEAFSEVINLLRQAGLQADETKNLPLMLVSLKTLKVKVLTKNPLLERRK